MANIPLSVTWSNEILLFGILCSDLYPIFKKDVLIVVLMSSFLSSLFILEISPLSDVRLVKVFSHSVF